MSIPSYEYGVIKDNYPKCSIEYMGWSNELELHTFKIDGSLIVTVDKQGDIYEEPINGEPTEGCLQ